MARVTRKELNECIAEAIASYIREGWEDDVVNAALNDPRAAAQFMKDFKDEKGGTSAKEKKEAWASRVKEMSYKELENVLKTNPKGTGAYAAAISELTARKEILKDKKDILSGEMIMPYGWEFDEDGYPMRKHLMKNDSSAWSPSGLSSRGMVSNGELEECISEAIARVLKEDVLPQSYFDDYIDSLELDNPNRKKTAAERAFEKDAEKDAKAKEKDDEKLAAAAAAEAPVEDDEEGNEDSAKSSNGAYAEVRGMSYGELQDILNNNKRGTAIFRAATREKMDRDAILKDKQDILNGEIVMPYGWAFDENGYPMRKHLFNNEYVDNVDMSNSTKANFHMLKNRMSARGGRDPKTAYKPEIGMQDASWV